MQEDNDEGAVFDPSDSVVEQLSDDRDNQSNKAMDWLKSKPGMIVSGLAILLVIVGGFLMLGSSSDKSQVAEEPEQTTPIVAQLSAALSLVEGTVQYSTDGTTWSDAVGGETISEGDFVRTLDSSRAVLLHDDGSAIRLDSDTQVQLTTSDSKAILVELDNGQVYSRVVSSENRTFTVATETEQFEALGTAFKTSTTDETNDVQVYESSVRVVSNETQVDEGQKYETTEEKVSELSADELKDDAFVQWNKQQDESDDEFKNKLGFLSRLTDESETSNEDTTPSPATDAPSGIVLSGSALDSGIKLSWTVSGVDTSEGFKIVQSKTSNTPVYGTDTSTFVGESGARNYILNLKDGKSYYLRICAYRPDSGGCDSYSNTIQITAPNKPLEAVQAGAVTLSLDGNKISWTFAGTAPHGFKVLLGSSSGPTYPNNSIQYVGASKNSYTLSGFATGTYYVKICKYTADSNINGGCTDYSNEIEYVVSP